MKHALLICYGDSFIRPSVRLGERFRAAGYECTWFLCSFRGFDPNHAGPHLRELGFDRPFLAGKLHHILDEHPEVIRRTDVIAAGLPGSDVRALVALLDAWVARERPARRPIVAAYYNGISYQNSADGCLSRTGADVHAVNSPDHAELARRVSLAVGADPNNIRVTGLPALDAAASGAASTGEDILFAAQPTVPATPRERAYLIWRLADLAESRPDRTVWYKPRQRPGQATMHHAPAIDERLLRLVASRRGVPENFRLTYEPISQLLRRSSLCVTVSSTAAFEALAGGVRVALLSDFGLPDLYGGNFFLGSGLYTTLDRLIAGQTPTPDEEWLRRHLLADGRNCDRLIEAADELAEAQLAAGLATPVRAGFPARRAVETMDLGGTDAGSFLPIRARWMGKASRALLRVPGLRAAADRARLAAQTGAP